MYGSVLEITEVASIFSEDDMLILSLGFTHRLARHLGTTRGIGFPILTCSLNRELSSECLDLL